MHHEYRDFLKDVIRKRVDFSRTAQSLGREQPPWQKPCRPGEKKIALDPAGEWSIPEISLKKAIASRKSRRKFANGALSIEELSFLLWATQGLRPAHGARHNFRTVPSAGCRHSLETYILAFRVTGLGKAIYRYLPLDHALVEEARRPGLEGIVAEATFGQRFCSTAAATFVWTTIPARMEWRYAEASYKVIALDAGHVCQNLYLASEAIGAGACAVAAYDQEAMDRLLGVDGIGEFTLYLAPVGKKAAAAEDPE
jgi:SagB-type dehydrogenase family enzyme